MSGRIPRSFIDELLVRVDIVDLIDSHLQLKKTGANYAACCPFHNEKTPSFSVNRAKQFFYCFGCGAGGNAISFLMDYNNLDFVEAIEDLASFVGVDVPRETGDYQKPLEKQDVSHLYEVSQQVALFYAQQLREPRGQVAVNYFKSRGVSGRVARDFLLGYAPDEWQLLATQFDEPSLIEAGLIIKKPETGRTYDRFRGRIMFPIRDKRGRVVGFGGRVLDDSTPKYLNSPETPLFQKGKEVYGLYELLLKQTKPLRILVVEGYMDVVILAEFGIDYSVATLGTATSQSHFDLLFRFSKELILCFDGDSAGQKAAWRAVEAVLPVLKEGRQLRVMLLPQGEDPDSLVRLKGKVDFEVLLNNATPLSDYFFDYLSNDTDLEAMESRASLANTASPLLNKLPHGVFREMMEAKLKALVQLGSLKIETPSLINKPRTNKASPMRTIIALLLLHPQLAEVVMQKQLDLEAANIGGMSLLKSLLKTIAENPQINLASLVEVFRGTAEESQINALANSSILISEQGIEGEFLGALTQLATKINEQQLDSLMAKEKHSGLTVVERQQFLQLLSQK